MQGRRAWEKGEKRTQEIGYKWTGQMGKYNEIMKAKLLTAEKLKIWKKLNIGMKVLV